MRTISVCPALRLSISLLVACAILSGIIQAAEQVNAPKTYLITDYGAVGDGKTLNTDSIQKAIDICHDSGGGKVVVPSGIFVTGALRLRGGVTIYIDTDGTLQGSRSIKDWAMKRQVIPWAGYFGWAAQAWGSCLIYAENAENITLEGKGTIDGQGGPHLGFFPNQGSNERPMIFRTFGCKNITLRGITFTNPASFTTLFSRSEGILIDGIKIRSRKSWNGDGLDFDGCRNVVIKNCDLDCGDDAISPKTLHPDWPNENFTITNNRLSSTWAAIRLGPESVAPMRNFVIQDNDFVDCRDGIKLESTEGAIFENLEFSNIRMQIVNRPIFITTTRFLFSAHSSTIRPPQGIIRDVRISNVTAVIRASVTYNNKTRNCAAIASLPNKTIEKITLSNIDFTFPGGNKSYKESQEFLPELFYFGDYLMWATPFEAEVPASVFFIRNVRKVIFENIKMSVQKSDSRPFIALENTDQIRISRVEGRSLEGMTPALISSVGSSGIDIQESRVSSPPSVRTHIEASPERLAKFKEFQRREAALDSKLQTAADLVDIAAATRQTLPLPDRWDYRTDPTDEGEKSAWFFKPRDSSWNLQTPVGNITRTADDKAPRYTEWYATEVNIPASVAGANRVLLSMLHNNMATKLWIDGQLVGERSENLEYFIGVPWIVDVTKHLFPGTHQIVIQARFLNSNGKGFPHRSELKIIR